MVTEVFLCLETPHSHVLRLGTIAHPICDFSDADGVISPLAMAVAVAALAAQLPFAQPRLTRLSDVVLAIQEAPRSHARYAYVALEAIKLLALVAGGVLLLAS